MRTTHAWIVALATLTVSSGAWAQDAETPLDAARRLKAAGDCAGAVKVLEGLLATEPDHHDARFNLAWCLVELEQHELALPHLEKLKIARPAEPRVWFESGYVLDSLQRYDAALRDFRRCLELKPDYRGIHRALGFAHYGKGDYRAAADELRKHARTVEEIKEHRFWYRLGYCLNAIEDYAAAKEALLKARALGERDATTHLELGYAAEKLKQDFEAIGHYQKAIELDPKSHIGYNGIASVYRDNRKDFAKAMEWYGKTLALNPKERKANYGIGYCLNAQGKFAEAVPYLQQAIASEPGYVAPHVELGYAYVMTGRVNDGIAKLRRALELSPKHAHAHFYLVEAYLAAGDRAAAQRHADALQPIRPDLARKAQDRINRG